MGKWVVGRSEPLAIDLGKKDIYGKSGTFNVIIGSNVSAEPDTFEGVMNELIVPVDVLSCNANGDTPAGSTKIPVDDASNWEVGYVAKVKDKDIYFYVDKVDTDNNVLYARSPIDGDIADGDEIDRVGNTGVYSMSYTPQAKGKYIVIINNPSIGLFNKAKSVECVEHDEDSIYEKMVEELEAIKDAVRTVDGEVIL